MGMIYLNKSRNMSSREENTPIGSEQIMYKIEDK